MKKVLLISILFVFTSCSKNNDNITSSTFTPINLTSTLIFKGSFGNFSYNPTQHGEVITNQADWDNFRNNYWLYGLQLAEANSVNFNNEMIILAFDKPRTTTQGTLDVNFSSIIENQNEINVQITYSGEAGFGQTPSRIGNFVKIAKSNKPVVFH